MHPITIEQEILTALETYHWKPSAAVYNFALDLNYSESYIRNQLGILVANKKVEKVFDGYSHNGRRRFIYKVIHDQHPNIPG